MESHTGPENTEQKLKRLYTLGDNFNKTFDTLIEVKNTGEAQKAINEMEKFLNSVEELGKLNADSLLTTAIEKKMIYYSEDVFKAQSIPNLYTEVNQIKEMMNVFGSQLPALKKIISDAKMKSKKGEMSLTIEELNILVSSRIQDAIKIGAEVLGISFDVLKEALDEKHPPISDFE